MEDTSGIELEYPTQQYTPAENRRHTWWILLLGGIAGLLLFAGEHALVMLGPVLHGPAATIALYVFLIAYFARRRPWWRRVIYLVVCPAVSLVLCLLREPFLILLVAMFLATLLADRFATHYFHLKTTVPMPRDKAFQLRRLWTKRCNPLQGLFGGAPIGVELYLLSLLTISAAGVWLVYLSQAYNVKAFPLNFLITVAGLGVLFLAPVVWELCAAFLSGRTFISPALMLRGFRAATVDWFTYNRKDVRGPGVFRSPAGTYRHRRWMSLALMVLFGACFAQVFSYWRTLRVILDARQPDAPLHRKLDDKFRDLEPYYRDWEELQKIRSMEDEDDFPEGSYLPSPRIADPTDLPPGGSVGDIALRSVFGPTISLVSLDPAADQSDDLEGLKLQPYQEAMLKHMDPDKRREQIAKWRERQQAEEPSAEDSQPAAASDSERKESAQEGAERVSLKVFLLSVGGILVVMMYVFFPILSVIIPPAYLLACCYTTSARVVGFYARQFGKDAPRGLLDHGTWAHLVTRVQASRDNIEKHSLFLGVNAADSTPVMVPREVFQEHAHLLGDSGSGKTSLGMASLIAQLIRFGDSSVVVIDLKGYDLALLEGTRIEAEQVDRRLKEANKKSPREDHPDGSPPGYPFRWFTNEMGRSSYVFNPLTQAHFGELTLYQRTDILTAAMGLQYGTDYGRGYYSDANAQLLYKALEKRRDVRSFFELEPILEQKHTLDIDPELSKAASHLQATVSRLAACEPLNAVLSTLYPPGAIEHAIDMADVFHRPQALYFHLPSVIGSASSAEIARFVLYSLLVAAKFVGPKRKQVYLLIDEFQRIVASNLELILQTARRMNVGVILANQTLSDLHTPNVDLIPTVRANTRFRQVFAASDLIEQQELVHSSGETIVHNRSWSQYFGVSVAAGAVGARSHSETVSARLRSNDVILATDHPFQSIVCIRRGKGYAQFGGMPFIMTSTHHIDFEEYKKRRTAPWPERPDQTIPSTQESPGAPVQPIQSGAEPGPDPLLADSAEEPKATSGPAGYVPEDPLKALSESARPQEGSSQEDTLLPQEPSEGSAESKSPKSVPPEEQSP